MPNTVKGVEIDPIREKLIELMTAFYGVDPMYYGVEAQHLADHLISNGVTVQQWIPVTERLPELIPCGAGTAYSEAVNVLTTGRKVITAIWDGFDWTCDAEFWDAEDEEITHWTPVLLPLPEPPKGE